MRSLTMVGPLPPVRLIWCIPVVCALLPLCDTCSAQPGEDPGSVIVDMREGDCPGSQEGPRFVADGVLRMDSMKTQMISALKSARILRDGLSKDGCPAADIPEANLQQGHDVYARLIWSSEGFRDGEDFGMCVSGLDDFNGDGYDDMAIGGEADRAYVLYGGPAGELSIDMVILGCCGFGRAVATAGDVNGDGFGDLLIGAPLFGLNQTGKAYLFWGGMQGDSCMVMTGTRDYQRLGTSLAPLGDVNGDGYDDIIIGTEQYQDWGEAFVFFGGTHMDTTPDLVLRGRRPEDYFGFCVAGAGDLNGDTYHDIIVGNGQKWIEEAYIYWGGLAPDASPDLIVHGPLNSDFGWNVGCGGDINGDGYDDALVSAHWYTPDRTRLDPGYGRVYVYFGGERMDQEADMIIEGTKPLSCFGLHFTSVGDMTADGYDDIVIGSHCEYGGEMPAARFFPGGPDMATHDTLADLTLTSEHPADWFASALHGLHDVDGNGFPDLLVGARFYPGIGHTRGKAYVYSIWPDRRGDVNDDGYVDICDVMGVVRVLLVPGDASGHEMWSSDFNGDTRTNALDIVAMVREILHRR